MKIFVSYAHNNANHAVGIQKALEIHQVWFDQRLRMGQDWWSEIEKQIASCDCLLFLLSPDSEASEYCQKEVDFAMKLGKPIAPVMVESMPIPDRLQKYQVIAWNDNDPGSVVGLLNGLFEIERQVFNPLRPVKQGSVDVRPALSIADLVFVTTNANKKRMYEQILGVPLQIYPIDLLDIQNADPGTVALHKASQAYDILKKPVFVEQSAMSVKEWGGFPGALTNIFIESVGLQGVCKMLQSSTDKQAEAISVIAFTDGKLKRKFIGTLPGAIADQPHGNSWSWNTIFIPAGFDLTLGDMSEEQVLSLTPRRRVIIDFMQFLQANYDVK